MSIDTLFPKNKKIYDQEFEKIIILIGKPKTDLEINEWETHEIHWTITNIKNSYLITNKFLHQNYLQKGIIKDNFKDDNIQNKTIYIAKLLPNKYEFRIYIKFINTLNNKFIEKYNLISFTISIPNNEKILTTNKIEKESCFYNNCVILEKQ